MAFGARPHHTRHQRLTPQSLARHLRAWREGKNLSQSEAALKLQISKRTLQDRSAPRGFARTAIEKMIRP
jgi:DNA-binding transcriptional regulator YiaG